MIISHTISSIWQHIPDDIDKRLGAVLDRHNNANIFFRADDVAIPSAKQQKLIELFSRYDTPLCVAIVPAWLNQARWADLCRQAKDKHHLFAWHQHGWNHRNHEPSGKKQEFGPGATKAWKYQVAMRGRDKLYRLLGQHFLPVFTPPWNRLDLESMHILKELGFHGISRFHGAKVETVDGLPDLAVNIDLHTRKENSPSDGWNALLKQLDYSLQTGRAGFMIHHQRMNKAAFSFLERLLSSVKSRSNLRLCHFGHLLEQSR